MTIPQIGFWDLTLEELGIAQMLKIEQMLVGA